MCQLKGTVLYFLKKLSEELKATKGKLHAHKCDLTKEEEMLALFDWIKTNLGGVDICINNAGVSYYINKLLTGSEGEFI